MAADKDKNAPGGDPIERAMARRAEAEKAAREAAAANKAPRDSVIGAAMDRPRPAKPANEPASTGEDAVYQPDEGSFFAPSAEERAEQARRAAQRVRRRAKGEDVGADPAPEHDPAPDPTPEPEPIVAAPVAPKPQVEKPAPRPSADELINRASQRSGKAKIPPPPTTVTAPPPARPTPEKPAAAKLPPRAMPVPRPPKPTPAPPAQPAQKPARPPEVKAAKPASAMPIPAKPVPAKPDVAIPDPAAPKPEVPAFAKMASAVPLMDRVTLPGKPAIAVQAAAKPEPVKPPKARIAKTVRATSPEPTRAKPPIAKPAAAPRTEPAIGRPQPVAVPAPTAQKPVDSFEAAYTDFSDDAVADDSIYAAPSVPQAAKTKAFAPFEWMIASRYLRARKKEGFVSVIAGFSLVGIALGVATLIVVMAVMTGFRETLIHQIIGGSPHINVVSQSERFDNFDVLADNLRKVDGVQYVAPVVESQVLATGKRNHSGVYVRGIRKSDLVHLIDNANPEFTRGSLTGFTPDTNVAAVGANLAAKLGLRVGDYVSLTSPDGDITPMSVDPMPRKKAYKIVYTFKLGVQEVDYGVVFLPFKEAQIYLNKQGVADKLDIFVDDANNVDAYSNPIFQAARSSISLYNWKTSNGRLIGAINLERQVMFVILTMIILVAALNIISGLVMLVKDKSRDVAIMRTMGMARGSILRIFFICGSSIGVIGSVLGVIIGVAFVWNIKSVQTFVEWATGTTVWDPAVRAGMTEIPTKMQFSDVSLTLFIALGLSFIATLYPAWKAAKLDPVEALRYE